jgi:hypothetical protein
MQPLDGILVKFERADENIRILNEEISAYVRALPTPYEVIKEFQNEGRDYVVRVRSSPPPLRFAVLTGEVVHHLRTILDYLIWVLVAHAGGKPSNTHQFPICRTTKKFEDAIKRGNIKGVSAEAAELIGEAQPFKQDRADDYVLTVLHELDIQEKHRLPLVVVASARLGERITITNASRPIELCGISPPDLHQITEDGAEVVRITLSAADPVFSADIDLAVQIALEITGGEIPIIPVTDLLAGMSKAAREIVGRFAPELGYTVRRVDG